MLAGTVAVLACSVLAVTGLAKTEISRYKVGEFPIDVAVGDFNRDGRDDLALTIFQGDPQTVAILRGRRNGRFAKARQIPLEPGDQPDGLVATRIGAGKDQDLVVGTLDENVLVLKGKKGVGFAAPKQLPIGGRPRELAVGDFDQDGTMDLALSRQDAADVAIALGQGGLNFGAPVSEGGAGGSEIIAARLDLGNDLDLLTIDHGTDGLMLLRGQPGAGFAAAEPLPATLEPFSIAVADLNEDGMLDIIAGLVGDRPRLSVSAGAPGGIFAAPVTLTLGPRPMVVQDIAVTKLNRDGDPDLVITGAQQEGVRAAHRWARGNGPPLRSRVLFLKGRSGLKLKRLREIKLTGSTSAVAAERIGGGKNVDAAVAWPARRNPGKRS